MWYVYGNVRHNDRFYCGEKDSGTYVLGSYNIFLKYYMCHKNLREIINNIINTFKSIYEYINNLILVDYQRNGMIKLLRVHITNILID